MSAPGVWWVWKRFTGAHAALYRASGGRIGGTYGGAPVLSCFTTSAERAARSGSAR